MADDDDAGDGRQATVVWRGGELRVEFHDHSSDATHWRYVLLGPELGASFQTLNAALRIAREVREARLLEQLDNGPEESERFGVRLGVAYDRKRRIVETVADPDQEDLARLGRLGEVAVIEAQLPLPKLSLKTVRGHTLDQEPQGKRCRLDEFEGVVDVVIERLRAQGIVGPRGG